MLPGNTRRIEISSLPNQMGGSKQLENRDFPRSQFVFVCLWLVHTWDALAQHFQPPSHLAGLLERELQRSANPHLNNSDVALPDSEFLQSEDAPEDLSAAKAKFRTDGNHLLLPVSHRLMKPDSDMGIDSPHRVITFKN